jgi:hypothetical protein
MDLETLLCSRQGFGLESATFLQRARSRAIDGVPLDDLLARASDFERRSLDAAIGCNPSALPVGAPPVEFADFEPVRCGKSLGLAALAVARSQTVDVGIVKPGEEPPRVSLLATQLDQARTLRGHLNIVNERPKLKKLKIGEDDDSITLRHPSGLPIEIKVIAASRGGYSLASRWCMTMIADEGPGWFSTGNVFSLEDSRDQALNRLLPGAQAIYAGSVWQASGLCFELHRDHFGKPTKDLVVFAPAAVDGVSPAEQLNPAHWSAERVAHMKRKAPRSFRMHVMNLFGGASNVFDFDAVENGFRKPPLRARSWGHHQGVIDWSSGKKDAATFAVCQQVYPELPPSAYVREEVPGLPDGMVVHDRWDRPIIRPDYQGGRPFLWWPFIGGFEGSFWEQLPADEAVRRIAEVFNDYGVTDVHGDQREAYMLEAEFRRYGLRFHEHPYTSESKARAVERVRRWLAENALIFNHHDKLRAEFHAFVEKPTPGGGWTFGARGSGHDDYVSLVLTAALADMDGDVSRSPIARDRGRGGVPHEALG